MSDDALSATATDGSRRLSKLLPILGFGALLAVVAILVSTPVAAAYEVSIYLAYPWYFWLLVVGALVIGLFVVLRGALSPDPRRSNWRVGFLLSLLVGAVIVFMPYIRGYPVYGRADVLTHVGYVGLIERIGGGAFVNIYQNLHQLVLALAYATGLEPIQVINAVAGFISLFFFVACYTLLAAVFDHRRALLTLPFVLVVLGGRSHLNPSPFSQSVLLLPFVLYLFVKAQRTGSFPFRFALAAGVVGLVTFHPLTALFFVCIVGIHYAVVFVTGRGRSGSLDVSGITTKNTLSLSVVLFLGWYYNFTGIIIRFENSIRELLFPSEDSALDSYTSTASQYSPALIDVLKVWVVQFGQLTLYLGIGVLAVLQITATLLRRRSVETPYLVTFALGFVLFSALGVVFLTVDLVGGFGRPLQFAKLFAALMTGSLLASIYESVPWRRGFTGLVAVALVVLVAVSMSGIYYNSVAGESNHHVTEQDLDGAAWFFDTGMATRQYQEFGTSLHRFEHALGGTIANDVPDARTRPPDHFNYTRHPTVGESYDRDQTMVLTERGRLYYPTAFPGYEQFWRFTPRDFERLMVDPTVSRVYDNGEFDVYRIEARDGS